MTQIGMYGSPAHIITNKNIEPKEKAKTILKTYGESSKDLLKTTAGAAATAGVAATAVGVSQKAATTFNKMVSGIGNTLSKVKIEGTGPKGGAASLKNYIKNSSVGKKFLALPAPAKAAIMAGAAALTLGLSLVSISTASKAGYIEGAAEKKVDKTV